MKDLDNSHWQIEGHRQRMTEADWREILLADRDTITVKGHLRKLIADPLGYGVVEIFKEAE